MRGWSPTRYGSLDVTGNGSFITDQLSYDIFAQAAQALRSPGAVNPLAGLEVERVLAIGASQSASRMTIYYNVVLPQEQPVFDGYAFIVGTAPTRVGTEPIIQVLSETDVTNPATRRPDSDVFRRWEVAGAAHSGWEGQEYRRPLSIRDLGAAPVYECTNPPFSRVWLSQPIEAAYEHLARWVDGGAPPPHAPYLEFDGTTKVRNELGLAQGGIQLSQVAVPTALNTGSNSGAVVLHSLRHPRAVRRRAAGRPVSKPRQVRQRCHARGLGQRRGRVPPAAGRAGEPPRSRSLQRGQVAGCIKGLNSPS